MKPPSPLARLRLPPAAAVALLCAGCSLLPEPRPDPTRFYVLTSRSTAAGATTSLATVQLRPVEVAGYLRNRAMVIRRGASEIEFREHARWGEPLEQGVARVLAAGLRARGIAVAAPAPGVPALAVRILACEGGAEGAVIFRAGWDLSGAAAPVSGEFSSDGLRWDGKSEESLASLLGEAVDALAREIASGCGKP